MGKNKENKEKCPFSQGGYCACWEQDGDQKCDGKKIPQGCPAEK